MQAIPVFQDERGNTIIGDISKQSNVKISFGGGVHNLVFLLVVAME